jgi:hypothetical protein
VVSSSEPSSSFLVLDFCVGVSMEASLFTFGKFYHNYF